MALIENFLKFLQTFIIDLLYKPFFRQHHNIRVNNVRFVQKRYGEN